MNDDDVPAHPVKPIIVADTGPLLCAGLMHGKLGGSVLFVRYKGRLVIPSAVKRELLNMTRKRDGKPELRRAAGKFSGTHGGYVTVDQRKFKSAEKDEVLNEIIAAEKMLGETPKIVGHDGEKEGILLAASLGGLFLSNDRAASKVARSRGLEVASFANILGVEIDAGKMTAEDAVGICDAIQPFTWPGLSNPTALRFTQMNVPEGF